MIITLILAAITFLFYFIFSSSLLYIPQQVLMTFGFSFSNLLGLASYSFAHISLSHLFGNVVVLIAVGIVAEQKLRRRDMLAIYFLSGTVAAVLFNLMEPGTVLVGSSAAISGLVMTAILVDIKKCAVAVITALLLLSFVIQPLIADYVIGTQVSLAKQNVELNETLNETLSEKNQTLASMQEAEQQFQQGAITNEAYAARIAELGQRYQNLSVEENRTASSLNTALALSRNVEEGRHRESVARTSLLVHVAGAMVGLLYIWLFRRDIIWSLPSQLSMPAFLSWRPRR